MVLGSNSAQAITHLPTWQGFRYLAAVMEALVA